MTDFSIISFLTNYVIIRSLLNGSEDVRYLHIILTRKTMISECAAHSTHCIFVYINYLFEVHALPNSDMKLANLRSFEEHQLKTQWLIFAVVLYS